MKTLNKRKIESTRILTHRVDDRNRDHRNSYRGRCHRLEGRRKVGERSGRDQDAAICCRTADALF